MNELLINIIIGFLVGLASAYVYSVIIKWHKNNSKISWSTINKGIKKLVVKISNNPNPDFVIGMGRSGSIIGAMIAGNLGGIPFLSQNINREFKDNGSSKIRTTSFPNQINYENLKNSKVLIVVCNNITGGDLQEWIKTNKSITDANNIELEFVSLFQSDTALVKADYHAFDANNRKFETIHTKLPWMLSPSYKHSHK